MFSPALSRVLLVAGALHAGLLFGRITEDTSVRTLSPLPTPSSSTVGKTRQSGDGLRQAVRTKLVEAGLSEMVSEIEVEGGNVLLRGNVPDEPTRTLVIETIFEVDAVESVDSELVISDDAPPAPEPRPTEPEPTPAEDLGIDDQTIEEQVWEKLEEKELRGELGDLEVSDGVVTLKGKVRSEAIQKTLIAAILEVEAVAAVESDLELATAEGGLELVQQVVQAVLNYPNHGVFDDIMVGATDDGSVMLFGVVTEPFKRDELEDIVSGILGVTELDNQLRVLPVSPNDQELRIRLFEAIYGDQLFRHLANRRNPPIHIIVEKGRVTLKGVVNNQVQRMKAASIARSVFGVFRVDNQLQTGS